MLRDQDAVNNFCNGKGSLEYFRCTIFPEAFVCTCMPPNGDIERWPRLPIRGSFSRVRDLRSPVHIVIRPSGEMRILFDLTVHDA